MKQLITRIRKRQEYHWRHDKFAFFMEAFGAIYVSSLLIILIIGFFQLLSDTLMETIAWAASVFGIVLIICITSLMSKRQALQLERDKVEAEIRKEEIKLLVTQEDKERQIAKREASEAERNLLATKNFPRQVS